MSTIIHFSDRCEPCATCKKPAAKTVYLYRTVKMKPVTPQQLSIAPVYCNITCFKERNKQR